MHRPHAHVADEQVRQPVKPSELLGGRVEVGQDLGWMLAPAVTAVDHRNRCPPGGLGGRALLEVAHRNDVAVVLQHVHRVLDRLLVEVAGPSHLGVREAEDVAAQAVHGRLRGQTRARARLVERRQERLVREQLGIPPALRDRGKLVADLEHALEISPFEVLERQNVSPEEASHLPSSSQVGLVGRPP